MKFNPDIAYDQHVDKCENDCAEMCWDHNCPDCREDIELIIDANESRA